MSPKEAWEHYFQVPYEQGSGPCVRHGFIDEDGGLCPSCSRYCMGAIAGDPLEERTATQQLNLVLEVFSEGLQMLAPVAARVKDRFVPDEPKLDVYVGTGEISQKDLLLHISGTGIRLNLNDLVPELERNIKKYRALNPEDGAARLLPYVKPEDR